MYVNIKMDHTGTLQTEDLCCPLVVGCTIWSGAGTLSYDSHKCLKIWSYYEMCVTCSTETVNDGQFHTVELVTFNRMLNLSVDGGKPTTLDSLGRSQLVKGEAPLYVGGKSRGTSGGKQATFKVFGVDRICVWLQGCLRRWCPLLWVVVSPLRPSTRPASMAVSGTCTSTTSCRTSPAATWSRGWCQAARPAADSTACTASASLMLHRYHTRTHCVSIGLRLIYALQRKHIRKELIMRILRSYCWYFKPKHKRSSTTENRGGSSESMVQIVRQIYDENSTQAFKNGWHLEEHLCEIISIYMMFMLMSRAQWQTNKSIKVK